MALVLSFISVRIKELYFPEKKDVQYSKINYVKVKIDLSFTGWEIRYSHLRKSAAFLK